MEFASGILSSIFTEIGKYLVEHSIHHANYLLRFENIVEDLRTEVQNLRSTQLRVEQDVERAKRNTEEIEEVVEKWRTNVQNVLEEIRGLEVEIEVNKTFLCGQCPNWRWRYKLSRRAVKKTSEMSKLRESGNFSRVSHSTTLPGVQGPKDFISFKPMEDAFSQIMEALKNDKINMVGLYGMGGGCTILLTTRQQQVCSSMGCQSRIQLNTLNEEEGLILLRKHAGIYNADVSPTLNALAKEVVGECGCLPIAIEAIGSALREKDVDEWKVVSDKLKMSKFPDIETVDQNVYACLKLSYDYLKAEETKFCFLLCSLFPEDYEINLEELLRYGLGLDVYGDAESIEDARTQLRVTINNLKSSCLLLDAKEGFVKMHDLVRDVALWITSKGENDFMFKAVMRLMERPRHQGLEQCTAISLMGNRIKVLPDGLYDIRVNDDLYDWSCDSHPKSRLLKIRGIEATSLITFKALYENVEYLELVGIKGCCQNMVPSIDMTQQQDVPSNAFSNLMDLSLDSVGLREICSGGRPPRGFLENLETLKISSCHSMSCLFPSWVLIQRLGKLKEVTVSECRELEDVFQLEGLSYAKENPFLLSSLESLLLHKVENLRYIWKGPTQQVSLQSLTVVKVKWCNELRYLFTLSLARSLLQLEQLTVKYSNSLEHIVEIKEAEENVGGGGGNNVMFPKLRKLKLGGGLPNFINFFDSENYSSNWPALQELSLYLPLNSITSFATQLEANMLQTSKEKLRVLDVGIISDQLCNSILAQLIHGFQNLEELNIGGYRVQVLSQLELSLPSLKELHLVGLEELECLCKGPTYLLSLPNLKILKVDSCNRLRHMFSPSLARNFMQLEDLSIAYCGELEQIFNEDDAAEYNQTLSKDHLQWPLLFPNLSLIHIKRCDKLKSMFPVSMAHLLSLQNLTTLKLDTCHGLTHLFSSTLARNLLQLESIYIEDCGELEQIIVEDHTEDHHVQLGLFPNLSSISVYKCGKLKTLFPAVNIARSGLQKLRTLIVEKSSQLEELFGHKGEADMTSDDREMVLPQLKELTLQELESLVNFCPIGYHFIFPSLSRLMVSRCPKITTRFSVDQNRSVHAEAKALQTGKEDVDMEQPPPETTREIYCMEWEPDSLQKRWCIMKTLLTNAPQTSKEDVDMERSPPETTREIECWDFDDLQSQLLVGVSLIIMKTLYGRLFYLKRHVSYKADIVA
ncbi:hypothetical protein Q3G72_007915 [Acer saccharum]|nr:hypothetical protein Q3G72_007915 [Acer saccharum]